jgi:hypothetical protein
VWSTIPSAPTACLSMPVCRAATKGLN